MRTTGSTSPASHPGAADRDPGGSAVPPRRTHRQLHEDPAMTTASVTPGPRPDDEREGDDRSVELGHEDSRSSDELKEAQARRLARMEQERATDEGMRPPAPAGRTRG